MNNKTYKIVLTDYCPKLQLNYIKLLLESFGGEQFFHGKSILELGPYNGVIGNFFSSLGANVHLVEGRQENVNKIKKFFPHLSVQQFNLDTRKWPFGHYDIILNFGLLYHLRFHHALHLINCIKHCSLLALETEVVDSPRRIIRLHPEKGDNQSLSDVGGCPSELFIESLCSKLKVEYRKICSPRLNAYGSSFDWLNTYDSNRSSDGLRRWWFIKGLNNNIEL